MSMTLLWALICLIIFIAVLAHPKLPNWMTFICLAPVALFSGIMESGLGNLFGEIIISLIGESRNLYVITAIVCIGASIATQFMNNMACAGVLAPVGIALAQHMGADPRAIAMAATSSYLTPMASGTNQLIMPFTNLKFQDFIKYGWPLLIINFICCIVILPLVFPFF